MKKKIVFALVMGFITTGIISLTLMFLNTNNSGVKFLNTWFKSWGVAYFIVIPSIIFISPLVDKVIAKILNK